LLRLDDRRVQVNSTPSSDPAVEEASGLLPVQLDQGEIDAAPSHPQQPAINNRRLMVLALLAPIAGGAAGAIDAIFRLALERADRERILLSVLAHRMPLLGFCCYVAGCAAALAISAWLVRRFPPDASGSGIPQVEAALNGDLAGAPPRLLPVKFFGGLLAIGAGAALGREGPGRSLCSKSWYGGLSSGWRSSPWARRRRPS
jgi:H+/Cl- antiporter ClcA